MAQGVNEAREILLGIAAQARLLADLLGGPTEDQRYCPHPKEHRKDRSTMGHVHWICGDCGWEEEEVIGDGNVRSEG